MRQDHKSSHKKHRFMACNVFNKHSQIEIFTVVIHTAMSRLDIIYTQRHLFSGKYMAFFGLTTMLLSKIMTIRPKHDKQLPRNRDAIDSMPA